MSSENQNDLESKSSKSLKEDINMVPNVKEEVSSSIPTSPSPNNSNSAVQPISLSTPASIPQLSGVHSQPQPQHFHLNNGTNSQPPIIMHQSIVNIPSSLVPVDASQNHVVMAVPCSASKPTTVYKLVPSYMMQYRVCDTYIVNPTPNDVPQQLFSSRPFLVASQPSVAIAIQTQASVPIQPLQSASSLQSQTSVSSHPVSLSSIQPQSKLSIQPQPTLSLQPQATLALPQLASVSTQQKLQNNKEPTMTQKSLKQENSKSKKEETIIRCSCGKTHCLKLYCDCLKAGRECGPLCSCVDCYNHADRIERKTAIQFLKRRNPHAFLRLTGNEQPVPCGCNCQRSQCCKKYCSCYVSGKPCCPNCNCVNCGNRVK